jgi:hypothetical protein
MHFEEKPLDEILCLRLVSKYGIGQAKYILPISIEEHEESFVVSLRDFPTQTFIRVRAQLLGTVRSFPENHLSLSRIASTKTGLLQWEISVADGHLPGMNKSQPSERQHTTHLYQMEEVHA